MNKLDYYWNMYEVHVEMIDGLKREVVLLGEAVKIKTEQNEILSARMRDGEMCCDKQTQEVAKLEKKVKRKAFWGNTKMIVGIGIGVVGTLLIVR